MSTVYAAPNDVRHRRAPRCKQSTVGAPAGDIYNGVKRRESLLNLTSFSPFFPLDPIPKCVNVNINTKVAVLIKSVPQPECVAQKFTFFEKFEI